jgi:hypothetical protein
VERDRAEERGAGTDPYAVFGRLRDRGEIGADFAANMARWRSACPTVELSPADDAAIPARTPRRRTGVKSP